MRFGMIMIALVLLAGCAGFGPSDPLDDVPRLSDVDASEGAEAVQIQESEDAPGFFAGLFGRAEATPSETAGEEANAEDTEVAVAEAAERPTGIFGRMLGGLTNAAATSEEPAVDARSTVPPLTNQPFGEVGVTCGLSKSDLGTEIANVSGYRVYDTFPNSTDPRPHYITGFSDRCARQFTAALVLTGDVGTHEIVRYQTAQARRPYSEVDLAYEALKAQFCGVGKGQPCGGRINALGRSTHFVTGYARFTSSKEWVEILLHKGDVIATGVERE